MINVNQITSQLARMPDQALQQYAMMHKNDPYTVSLALSESNRRKQMRDAAQGQQGMAPQPKVVDQGIASMAAPSEMNPAQMETLIQQLDRKKEQEYREFTRGAAPAPQPMPEDVGIGALPAPNMQGMAGGGIVAFAGEDESLVTDPQFGGVSPEAYLPVARTGRTQAEVAEIVQALRARGETVGLPQIMAIQEGKLSAPAITKTAIAPPVVIPSAAQTAPAVKTPPVDKGPAALGGAPRAPAAAPAGLSYLDRLKSAQTAMGPAVNPEQAAMDKLVGERNTGATEAKKELEADIASRADQFKGREERIGKREAELGKSKDTNTGMAFLEAGLAMMQSRGRGLAGVAEGAGVGVKQYNAGLKDLKAAQEKLDEARDRTDELKQNQSMMDKSAVRAANKDIRDASLAGQQLQIDARMKIYGENKADARAGVASDVAVVEGAKDRASRERVAAAPTGVERMARDLGGKSGLEAGLKKYSEIMGPEGKGLAALIANYAKDPTALKLLETTDPALAAIVKQQMQNMLVQSQSAPSGKAFP
jgi:hypothetical protein